MMRTGCLRMLRVLGFVGLALMLATAGGIAHAWPDSDQKAADEELEAWNLRSASAMVERLYTANPTDAFNLYLKGKVLHMRGQYREAIDWFAQARTQQEDGLFAHYEALAKSTHEVTKDYASALSPAGHFRIFHAPGLDAVLVPYAGEALDRAFVELTRIFDHVPETPIRVEIYPTVDVLGSVSPLTVAEIRTSGTIALCKYNRLMITSPRDLVYGYDWLDTLAHEFIHLLITQKSKNRTPIWLHEGMAKYYEVKWRRDAKPELDRHSESFLAKAIKADTLIPFEAMSPSMAKLPSQEATATAFAEVWTVMHFLESRAGGPVAAALTSRLGRGMNDREAVADVASLPWDRFEKTWKAYLKQQNFRVLDADYQQRLLFKGKDTEADELAGLKVDKARDHVWLGDRMRLRKRWPAAIDQYRKAATHVGPNSPLVQGKLGYALLRADRFEEAAVELRRPIAEHPRHVVLQVYLGEALLALGRYEEARKHLEEALTINPFDPDVHAHLARVYEQLGLADKAAIERNAQQLVNP
jgi:tetratricopeptide (TPR) repeat protein